MKKIKLAVGITSCEKRIDSELVCDTDQSIKEAGFEGRRIFVDAEGKRQYSGTHCTARMPPVKTYANWMLGMAELYARNPRHTHFLMFQDDILCCKNLREYLEHSLLRTPFTEKYYWNLCTHQQNAHLIPSIGFSGWYPSNQRGQGAQGLCFSREGLITLLTDKDTFLHPINLDRGHRNLDGHICQVMKKYGYTELVHAPSLLDHVGMHSTIDHPKGVTPGRVVNFAGVDTDIVEYMRIKSALTV